MSSIRDTDAPPTSRDRLGPGWKRSSNARRRFGGECAAVRRVRFNQRILGVFSTALILGCCTRDARGGSISATVYVGAHFEVRNHDQPTKYVFASTTRVASSIGSISGNSRIQRLRLYTGWNLVSLAVLALDLVGDLKRSHPGLGLSIYRWDPSTGSYLPVNSAQSLPAGTVLWIRSSANATLGILGAYVDPAARLVPAGGAYLAGTGLEAWEPVLPHDCSEWTYEASSGRWLETLAEGLPPVSNFPASVAPGQALFVQTPAAAPVQAPEATERVRYYHQDHLGSSAVITDAAGSPIQENENYPFGAKRHQRLWRTITEPYGFTQKERDQESDLHYFEARSLGSRLGRFISADPKYVDLDLLTEADASSFLADPQRGNLYAYVCNNPLRNTDPSGLEISTSLAGRAARDIQRNRNGSVTVTLHQGYDVNVACKAGASPPCVEHRVRDVKVTILPDTFDLPNGSSAQTGANLDHSPTRMGPRTTRVTYNITVRTRYAKDEDPSLPSAYGRGTTEEDKKNNNRSLRFHEGQHGARILEYIESHPLPQLHPEQRNKDFTADDDTLRWVQDFGKYVDDLDDFHKKQTDCVGHEDILCK
jgi:RHS repeat-associated protein